MSVPYIEVLSHRIQQTWLPHKTGVYGLRKVRRKNNGRWVNYGEIRRYKGGQVIYWAIRRFDEIYYEHNGWAIDHLTLKALQSFGVTHLGVEVKDTDQRYLMAFGKFSFINLDLAKAREVAKTAHGIEYIDWSKHTGKRPGGKGLYGAKQWVVPLRQWQVTESEPESIVDAMRV